MAAEQIPTPKHSWARSQRLPWIVVGVWLLGMAGAFWYFELRNQKPFVTQAVATFDSSLRAQAAADWFRADIKGAGTTPIAATVVHVYRADCPCNRFTGPHLAEIVARFRSRGVRFVAVRAPVSQGPESAPVPGGVQQMPATAGANAPHWIESTPAALVFDAGGKLVYFGPYSDAAWCSSSGGLVEGVLERTLSGQPPQPQRMYASGCYCDWKKI